MLFVLAVRNVVRNMHRLKPVIVVLLLGFCILFVANGILYSINISSSIGLRTSLTGDVSLSHHDMTSFSLLGSTSLLSGEYRQPKPIPFAHELESFLKNDSGVAGFLGVTTIPCLIELHATDEKKKSLDEYYKSYEDQGIIVERQPEVYYTDRHPVIGMDFSVAPLFLPGMELVAGSFPPPGQPGFMVQESVYTDMSLWQGALQSIFRFTSNINNSSFSIRDLPLYGVFRLPVNDSALAPLVLADHNSVRELAGLRLVLDPSSDIDKNTATMLGLDIDDMFGQDNAIIANQEAGSTDLLQGVLDIFGKQESVSDNVAEPMVDSGPWHFILIRLAENHSLAQFKKTLQDQGFDMRNQVLLRDWRNTVGGSALLVYVLQLVLNIGALFVILGVLLITTNGVMLSIFERSSEFAVIRAMGASKPYIIKLVVLESLLVVFGSAVLGLLLGALATVIINRIGLEVRNPYLVMMVGGNTIQSAFSLGLFLVHALGAVLMALVVCILPLRKVLTIQPSRVMA